jgi:hypothetical protein
MAIPNIKLLWERAGSKCALCRRRLDHLTDAGKQALLGEAAHIVAESPDGPRGNSILDQNERNSYLNLILLCPTCHTTVDKDPSEYPVERLHMFKTKHELRVEGQSILESENDFVSTSQPPSFKLTPIVKFATERAAFLPFYTQL